MIIVRKLLRIAIGLFVVVGLAGGGAAFFGYRATQQQPEFYAEAIELDAESQVENGYEFERRLLDLRNQMHYEPKWSATLTDEQINGWLAIDLPKKFPDALPSTISEPRVNVNAETAKIACRYHGNDLNTIASLGVSVHLTDKPNVVAVRILHARAGALPISVNRWVDEVTEAAQSAGVPLRWSTIDGDPVALVTLDLRLAGRSDRQLRLDHIEFCNGEIRLAGRTLGTDGAPISSEFIRTAAVYVPVHLNDQR